MLAKQLPSKRLLLELSKLPKRSPMITQGAMVLPLSVAA